MLKALMSVQGGLGRHEQLGNCQLSSRICGFSVSQNKELLPEA